MNNQRLSSDILEEQFGPTAVEILFQDDKTRISSTKVISSGQILELSLVEFIKSGTDKFSVVHKDIIAGQSIGKAFRGHGTAFVRETQSSFPFTLPDTFSEYFGSKDPASVISVAVLVGPCKTIYAKILETYSPSVRWSNLTTAPDDNDLYLIQKFNNLLRKL